MPTLVNYGGEDGGLYSISSHVDLYCPARKRARISPGSFSFDSENSFFFENRTQKPTIDALPDECLFEILRRVSSGRDRISAACVSKKWLVLTSTIKRAEMPLQDQTTKMAIDQEVEEDEGYLTRSLEGKKATDLRLAAISVRGGLGKLSIRGGVASDLGLLAISRGCSSLKFLSLWNVPGIGDEGVVAIAKGCPLLEKLDLCQCPSITNKGLTAIAENCPNLTTLSLESCSKIGNEGLQSVAKLCSKLQSLSIRDCANVGDHGVSSLVSSVPLLSKVKLQSLNITDFSIAVIGHYGKAVTSMSLTGLLNTSEKGFWVMGNALGLQKLVSLTISSCRGITDVSLEAMGKGCSSLKQMVLKKCCFISDEGLAGFAGAASSLESLHLEECHRITQSGIVGALSKFSTKLKSLTLVKCLGVKDLATEAVVSSPPCQSLRSLSIRNCPGFGSNSLASIGKLCPKLRNIDLSGLYGITDFGVLSLLESSSEEGLASVNFTGCLNLTDEVVISLAKLHGSTLEVLNLERCRKITDASLEALAEHCFSLGDLDLSNCSVSDSGIAALSCSNQINLQVLSLSGCSEVSNKSSQSLKNLGKTLVGLNLQNCSAIHSNIVESLIESLWRCDILF